MEIIECESQGRRFDSCQGPKVAFFASVSNTLNTFTSCKYKKTLDMNL